MNAIDPPLVRGGQICSPDHRTFPGRGRQQHRQRHSRKASPVRSSWLRRNLTSNPVAPARGAIVRHEMWAGRRRADARLRRETPRNALVCHDMPHRAWHIVQTAANQPCSERDRGVAAAPGSTYFAPRRCPNRSRRPSSTRLPNSLRTRSRLSMPSSSRHCRFVIKPSRRT